METKNNEIEKITNQVTNLSRNDGALPTKLSDTIQAVFPVGFQGKYCDIMVNLDRTNSGAGTVYTTPTDRDFYLTSATLSVSSDVSADTVLYTLDCIPYGSTVVNNLLEVNKQTLTAVSNLITYHDYTFPIRLTRGTAIRIATTKTVGTTVYNGSIVGFTYQQDITNIN